MLDANHLKLRSQNGLIDVGALGNVLALIEQLDVLLFDARLFVELLDQVLDSAILVDRHSDPLAILDSLGENVHLSLLVEFRIS